MTKLLALIEFKNPVSPEEGAHPEYIAQSFLNQKIGQLNPITVKVIPDLSKEQIEQFGVWKTPTAPTVRADSLFHHG